MQLTPRLGSGVAVQVAFDATGSRLAVGGDNGAQVFDLTRPGAPAIGSPIETQHGPARVQFVPRAGLVVTGYDGTITGWDLTGQPLISRIVAGRATCGREVLARRNAARAGRQRRHREPLPLAGAHVDCDAVGERTRQSCTTVHRDTDRVQSRWPRASRSRIAPVSCDGSIRARGAHSAARSSRVAEPDRHRRGVQPGRPLDRDGDFLDPVNGAHVIDVATRASPRPRSGGSVRAHRELQSRWQATHRNERCRCCQRDLSGRERHHRPGHSVCGREHPRRRCSIQPRWFTSCDQRPRRHTHLLRRAHAEVRGLSHLAHVLPPRRRDVQLAAAICSWCKTARRRTCSSTCAGARLGRPIAGSTDAAPHYGWSDFSPDGTSLLLPSPQGSRLWDLDPSHWLHDACTLAGRSLTHDEWNHYFSAFGAYRLTCRS